MQSLPSKPANKAVLINRNNVNIKTQVTPTTKSKLVYVNELNPSKPQPKIIHKAPILNQNKFKNYDSFKRKPSEKLRNVKAMEEVFNEHEVRMVSGGSDNHLLLIDTKTSFNLTGKEAETILEEENK